MLQFLHESNLINKDKCIINLSEANLQYADLNGADLSGANLQYVDLSEANLRGAFLMGANLRGAKVTDEQLDEAWSLLEATMRDGSINP